MPYIKTLIFNIYALLLSGYIKACKHAKIALQETIGEALSDLPSAQITFCKTQIRHCVKLFLGVSTDRAKRKYVLRSAGVESLWFWSTSYAKFR